MKRRLWLAALLMAALCTLPVLAGGEAAVRVMFATDLHYLSPSLCADSDLFLAAMRQGDGKLCQYSRELLQGLLGEARHQQPDALILTGDLTFNGEKLSHQELAEALRAFSAETGIPVWVIPGNHDILNPNARAFFRGGYAGTAAITEAEFGEIYAGMTGASPGACYSTVARVTDRVWVALLDVGVYSSTPVSFGVCREPHITFLRETLAEAEAAGATVLTASHQNLLDQTAFNAESFHIWFPNPLTGLLRESPAAARLHLSGHIHAQHIVTADGLTDAATGALSVSPHRFAMVTVGDGGRVTYEAIPLCDEHLPEGFQAMSREWFREITMEKERRETEKFGLSTEEEEALLDFAGDFNAAFFSGMLWREKEEMMASPAYQAWITHEEDSFFARYLGMLMEEALQDGITWDNK